jgi:hypothetical protein
MRADLSKCLCRAPRRHHRWNPDGRHFAVRRRVSAPQHRTVLGALEASEFRRSRRFGFGAHDETPSATSLSEPPAFELIASAILSGRRSRAVGQRSCRSARVNRPALLARPVSGLWKGTFIGVSRAPATNVKTLYCGDAGEDVPSCIAARMPTAARHASGHKFTATDLTRCAPVGSSAHHP